MQSLTSNSTHYIWSNTVGQYIVLDKEGCSCEDVKDWNVWETKRLWNTEIYTKVCAIIFIFIFLCIWCSKYLSIYLVSVFRYKSSWTLTRSLFVSFLFISLFCSFLFVCLNMNPISWKHWKTPRGRNTSTVNHSHSLTRCELND